MAEPPVPTPPPKPPRPPIKPRVPVHSPGHKIGVQASGEEDVAKEAMYTMVGGCLAAIFTPGLIDQDLIDNDIFFAAGYDRCYWVPATDPYPGLMYGPDGNLEPRRRHRRKGFPPR